MGDYKVICDYRSDDSLVCERCEHSKPHEPLHKCDTAPNDCSESECGRAMCRVADADELEDG